MKAIFSFCWILIWIFCCCFLSGSKLCINPIPFLFSWVPSGTATDCYGKSFFVVVAHNCYKLPSWLFLLNTIDFCVLHFYFYFKKLLINFLDLFIYHEYISVLYVCIVSWLVIDWLLTGSFVILWSEKILVIIFAVRVAICKLKFCCLLHGKKSIGEDMF